jgi:hypothetical protein
VKAEKSRLRGWLPPSAETLPPMHRAPQFATWLVASGKLSFRYQQFLGRNRYDFDRNVVQVPLLGKVTDCLPAQGFAAPLRDVPPVCPLVTTTNAKRFTFNVGTDLMLVPTYEFPVCQNVPLQSLHDLLLRRSRRQAQLYIKGVQRKDVTMRPPRRAWT